mmetsp:Transcript_12055/g.14950  ORF Transcript_12055/g.14950 Transcript_12055/m.14950 type:complete len:317 (-) Transcript_12055:1066-2016(-)
MMNDVENNEVTTAQLQTFQSNSSGTQKITQNVTKEKKRKGRHGARNQHRHKNMVKWIVQTFPESIRLALDNDQSVHVHVDRDECKSENSSQMHILDIAGGKGELSARLSLCHRLHVRMVDPREADILDCFHKTIFRSLPKKWQEKINSEKPKHVLENAVEKRFQQHVMCFPSDADGSTTISELENNDNLLHAVKHASLLIGMHADGATEAIVDIAMRYRKPFVIVPCCVFPNFFQYRFIPRSGSNDDSTNDAQGQVKNMVPVRSHEQFCRYLVLKDSHFKTATLPFEGRNTAIYWDGCQLDGDDVNKNADKIVSIL